MLFVPRHVTFRFSTRRTAWCGYEIAHDAACEGTTSDSKLPCFCSEWYGTCSLNFGMGVLCMYPVWTNSLEIYCSSGGVRSHPLGGVRSQHLAGSGGGGGPSVFKKEWNTAPPRGSHCFEHPRFRKCVGTLEDEYRLTDERCAFLANFSRAHPQQVELKPDLMATNFSAQNGFFFANMSKLVYSNESAVESSLKEMQSFKGLGDEFHWYQVREIWFECSLAG